MPTPVEKSAARWLAAIGEPTRLRILRALAAGEKPLLQLAKAVGAETDNVVHHKALRAAGLVGSERRGRNPAYALAGGEVGAAGLELTHPSGVRVTIPLG